jgi:arginine exporter protein ArgO
LLWLALGGSLGAHPHGTGVAFLALGAAAATASWFTLVAIVARHSKRLLTEDALRALGMTVSLTLVALACVRAGTLLG